MLVLMGETLGNKLCIIILYGWTNLEHTPRLNQRNECTKTSHTVYWISHFGTVRCENVKNNTKLNKKKSLDFFQNKHFT